MAKDPAFLFYTSDFTTGTQFFSDEQVGIYIRLLMAQHQHGHLSEKQVSIICKSYDKEVLSKFAKDDEGLYYNERLDIEISKRKTYSDSRRNNRKGNGSKEIEEKPLNNISLSYVSHMENENENKDVIVFKDKKDLTELEIAINEFKKMRVTTKKKMTPHAFDLIMRKLDTLAPNNDELKIQILNQSIECSYQTVYPLKQNNNFAKKEPEKVYKNDASKWDAPDAMQLITSKFKEVTPNEPKI